MNICQLPKKINKIIEIAYNLAKDNPHKFRLAAIALDKKNRIISSGLNNIKTHPYQAKLAAKNGHYSQIDLHAEMRAIVLAKREIETLVVVRILHNGEFALAKPCKICQEAIRLANIKNIIYSTDNGFNYERHIE